MTHKRIILAVSGSISAYKSADLANELTKMGHQVDVIMTKSATNFITPLTFQSLTKQPVHIDIMQENIPSEITHIELAKKADIFLVAPASANTIARLANGFADDMISTIALALKPDVKKYIAPAMNTNMYQNLIIQKNIESLKIYGYEEIAPRESLLACGDFGPGALATNETIITALKII